MVDLTKTPPAEPLPMAAYLSQVSVIAGFRLAVDTLAYGERSGALGLYNSPREYLSEVLSEMETDHAAQAH